MGMVEAVTPRSAELLRAQIRHSENRAASVGLGAAIVAGKVRNQRTHLQRLARRDSAEKISAAIEPLRGLLDQVPQVDSMDSLRGVEGMAARIYFDALGAALPEGFDWNGRSRRPPADAVNAALSYGYAILLGECVSALRIVGLEPSIGYLHSDSRGRPSLALDLMEEFRPSVVDRAVLSSIRRRELRPEHGRADGDSGGVLLTEAGRKVMLKAIESRLLARVHHGASDSKNTVRRIITLQAYQVKSIIEGRRDSFEPAGWR